MHWMMAFVANPVCHTWLMEAYNMHVHMHKIYPEISIEKNNFALTTEQFNTIEL